jgi:hypothetical protein
MRNFDARFSNTKVWLLKAAINKGIAAVVACAFLSVALMTFTYLGALSKMNAIVMVVVSDVLLVVYLFVLLPRSLRRQLRVS